MKIPAISNITKSIRKGIIGTMIAVPTAGTLQSCESMALVVRDMPAYVHPYPYGTYYNPYYRPVVVVKPAPPPKPHHVTPPPRHNGHGDTFHRGGKR